MIAVSTSSRKTWARFAPPEEAALNEDPPGRFYSKDAVAAEMARLTPPGAGPGILDLCAGRGALGGRMLAALPGATLANVDLDAGVRPACGDTLVADALDPCLASRLGRPDGFDLVLCNPPYGTVADAPSHRAWAEAAGLPHDAPAGRRLDAAWTFAARALRLTRPGGWAWLVLPDWLATGRRAEPFRRALVARHGLARSVALPEYAFEGTRARAFMLLVRRDVPTAGPVALSEIDLAGRSLPDVAVGPDGAARRLDRAHHAVMASASGPTLADLGAEAVRGRADPVIARARPGDVFHTTDFPAGAARASHALAGDAARIGLPFLAAPGDILVARVHRSLQRKVCRVSSGFAAPTTLVLRLRLPPGRGAAVAAALLSPEGEARLGATARGTGARTLASSELLAMPLPMT